MYSIYYVIFFLCLLLISLPVFASNNNINLVHSINIFKYFFLTGIFLIFYGLRRYVLTDWIAYKRIFEIIPSIFEEDFKNKFIKAKLASGGMEGGFLIFNIICKSISPDFYFFQLINTTIDFIFLRVFFKRYLKNQYYWGFLCFFIFYGNLFEINLMRNIKALLLFLFSIKYIEDKKFIKFFLINLFGTVFHSTAVLFIPLYFILDKRIKRKYILIIFLIGNVLFLLHVNLFSLFFEFLGNLISGSIGRRIVKYILNDFGTHGLSPSYLERILSFSLFFYCSKQYNFYENPKLRIIVNSFYIYIFLSLFFNYSIFYERIMPLFSFSYWILYPKCLFSLKDYNKKFIFALFILYCFYASFHSNNNLTARYDNVLFPLNQSEDSRIKEIQEDAMKYLNKTRK